ncbi:hypothetical protein PFICI_06787 [Pestalotiopsis fici W106-1]|uniref:Uncharacterized protein n=1 Tax=Pestalotiopsis fici (strain W106-1 / CGMCC3.15140) TaxID=1229662 RepID=W3X6W1_PESFW|nr:uncharacterized protein PFICI_06787 [Pestalotiopsis fici W106-1]ETS81785.1 hypothetical protein PFICI_06787 [Pestalotiopsis fici W106-1]
MASPLSPLPSTALNIATPATARRVAQEDMDGTPTSPSAPVTEPADASANQSSPFVSEVQDKTTDSPSKEDPSPSKIRHSRILSGNEIAPLTLLSPRDENLDPEPRSLSRQDSRSKSPRRPRFPIRPTGSSSPTKPLDAERLPEKSPERSPEKSPLKAPEMSRENSLEKHMVKTQDMTLEDALRANEGLKKAIQIFEDESTMMENDDLPDINAMDVDHPIDVDDSIAGPDESMVSTFSTFSAIPNMTMFAKIGHSPTRFANAELTPAAAARARPDPSPARSARTLDGGNTTSLLEFSDQLARNGTFSSSKRARLSPAKTTGHRPSATPQRHQGNLLDFDIPPLPTPRSVPTVTAREVETLKSQFLSEISSLKASLLGKEAEASSLKTAVTDAEKRVGETSEQLRELKAEKETLLEDKQTWEKRCQEMEDVLRRVKAEIHHGQRERQELESKLDESEKRREAAEIMAQEAESKIAGMRAGRVSPDAGADTGKEIKNSSSREVEIAVERVARELHALYKSKHEKKVTALKKSYANHWEKKVQALEVKIEEADTENEKLKQAQETAVTRVDPNLASENQELRTQSVHQSGQITELKAEVKQLGAVIESVKQDNNELIQLLEKERIEKGELVSLAEEMMSMQHSFIQQEEKPAPPSPRKVPEPVSARKSLARPMASGLRAPGSLQKSHTESRIGGLGHERTKSGGLQGGLPRPGMIMGGRSGIMSSIEKMGNHRGRVE